MGDGSGPAKGPQINPKALETTIERLNRTPYLYNSRGNIYYFAIGSNMLKSKLLNRGLGNTTIDIISMESGVAKNYRLAFNLRSFPPTEPSMASIEPAEGIDCHGGLVEMTVDNYHKLFLSEGGNTDLFIFSSHGIILLHFISIFVVLLYLTSFASLHFDLLYSTL